jgi:hypothetical protein
LTAPSIAVVRRPKCLGRHETPTDLGPLQELLKRGRLVTDWTSTET